jgi:putative ABC transport system permease protein
MFRNCLAAALRHLARNKLYTAVSVIGLAIGLSTALIAALVIRNQYTYDHFVPGYERTYVVQMVVTPVGIARQYIGWTPLRMAAQLRQQFPAVEAASRVLEATKTEVEYDRHKSNETVYWADPSLPDVLPPPGYAGDVAAALHVADSLIMSRSYARRFFDRDAPLGETLKVNGHPMVVRAVIQDPPANGTHQRRDIIAAGVTSFSPTNIQENAAPLKIAGLGLDPGLTYVRLKPGTDVAAFGQALGHLVPSVGTDGAPAIMSLELIRIDRLNTHEGMHPAFRSRMMMLGVLGAMVLLIAAVNFVNLQTARSALRAREAAIRTVAGATRQMLIMQFLGEALIYAAIATLLAVALTEWLLPRVNAFLDTGAALDYGRDPGLVGVLGGATILFGLLAGAWPAFVQSGVRSVNVLRGTAALAGGAAVRQGLVAVQFALLIALAICSGVVFRQREFAMRDALHLDRDLVLMIYAPQSRAGAFAQELRKLAGVRATTRATVAFLGSSGFEELGGISMATLRTKSGVNISFDTSGVDFDLFDFYGIKPLAGRLPSANAASPRVSNPGYVVLNESAARAFGLGSPAQAIGKIVPLSTPDNPAKGGKAEESTVLAVVPDFSLSSVAEAVPPTVYFQQRSGLDLISARLTGRDTPETLAAIDALWHRLDNADLPKRFYLDQQIWQTYLGVLRESQAFGICAAIAMSLSCIGLFALTAATAERRTKEIGIRKALGADTGDVLRLLLWQFSKPVVWASLLAWPVAAYVMSRWLADFAYHVELPIWMFPAAAFAALMIATATVATQSVLLARARPVEALRYE